MSRSLLSTLDEPKLLFVLSMGLGFFIWFFSLPLTGTAEPWDAQSSTYMASLVLAGLITGFLGPRHFWLWPIGTYLGQCAYVSLHTLQNEVIGADLFFPLGLLFLALAGIANLIGSALGAGLRAVVSGKKELNRN